MPPLVRMYVRNVAIGFVLAVVFTALLIGLNVGNLRHLVTAVQGGWLAVVMLVVFNTIVFGGVQFAIAVMRMAEPDDGAGGGLGQHARPMPEPVAILVPVAKSARHG